MAKNFFEEAGDFLVDKVAPIVNPVGSYIYNKASGKNNEKAPPPVQYDPVETEAVNNEQKNIDAGIETAAQNGATEKTKAVTQGADRSSKTNSIFVTKQQDLSKEAKENSTQSNKVYTDLNTKMSDVMNDASTQANSAMSLADYMNPDNKVAQDTRALYERQAQGEQQRGYADYGVLASLGSNSAANAMGGMGPMSLGQQMAYISQGQGQAGEAYARAQQRMQGLRDQGLTQGFEQSDKAYNAGQAAKKRQTDAIGMRENMNSNEQNINRGFRDEQGNYAGNIMEANKDSIAGETNARLFGANQSLGVAGLRHQNATGRNAGILAEIDKKRGISQYNNGIESQRIAAGNAQNSAMWSNILSTGGTIAGGMYGGPPGAMAGGAAGRAIAPQPEQAPMQATGGPAPYANVASNPYRYRSSYGGAYNA